MEYTRNLLKSVKNAIAGSETAKTVATAVGIEVKEEYEQTFRRSKTWREHQQDVQELRYRYPNRIPIIIEPYRDVTIDKKKYLVPVDITLGQFYYVLRARVSDVDASTGLFLFTDMGTIPPTAELISNIYWDYRNKDGYLYLRLMKENTFG